MRFLALIQKLAFRPGHGRFATPAKTPRPRASNWLPEIAHRVFL